MKREGIRKSFKKTLNIALSVAMIVGSITFLPQAKIEIYAAASIQDVNLGFGGISDPSEPTDDTWTGSRVYYGKNGEDAILWRVLDDSGFLFSEDVLVSNKAYNNSKVDITWSKSDLRNYLNKEDSDDSSTFLNTYFTDIEQDVINTTDVKTEKYDSTDIGDESVDKIFLLSVLEVQNAAYGFTNNADESDTRAVSSWWWLRSPCRYDDFAAYVDVNGNVRSDGYVVNDDNGSVRPTFNLNLDSVLFTSASEAIKSDFGVIGSDNTSTNTWKLTLKGTEDDLNANVTGGTTTLPIGYSEETLTISHSAATSILSDATQVSAMLVDSDETVLYYGKINDSIATSSTLTIPAGLSAGSYKLYVFAEDVNDGNETDYASAFGDAIVITVGEPPTPTPVPTPTPIWVSTADDAYRLSFVSGMPVEFTTSQVPYEFKLVNDLQGPLCFDVFHAYRGDYNIGFTYTSYANGMKVYSLSAPITVTLQIPNNIQKENRSYEMICVHEDGNVVILTDLDTNPNTITFTTDKGYAFALCYKD